MRIKRIVFFILATLMLSNVLLFSASAIRSDVLTTENASQKSELPAQYCMRDEYIVYAQNQDKHGYCWNFASTTAAATTIMKATSEYYDFSELWTAVSLYASDSNFNKMGQGGHISNQFESMKESGLMLECDLPYQYSYTVSNENAVDYYNFYEKYSNIDLANSLIQDSDTSFKQTEVDKIKNHIYTHGSIYLTFTFRTGFVESEGAYYLEPNQQNCNSNHAVSVIGWDDDFEREIYLEGEETPRLFKGAWIILNSYTETSGNDGLSFVFYEDENIGSIQGYKYVPNTDADLYFYDKIESGYAYPTNLKEKYYGDFTAEVALTKQKNIFFDDVALEYSYTISDGASIEDIEIFLDGQDVTDDFNVLIDALKKRFYISRDNADYGQYKVLVTYGNSENSRTYLNNFFVTYGLVGEEIEYDNDNLTLQISPGRDLEYYSFISSGKNYVIYTNTLSGEISFLPKEQSVYSDKPMSLPSISYEIENGESCVSTYTILSDTGYELNYNFTFVYYEDTSLELVNVYYDLGGGVNHEMNYSQKLAGPSTSLALYPPTREGYTFAGWYLDYGNGSTKISATDDVAYVSWDDIHHMGESPTMNASAYYKQYYNNSNTLFVYARWEEEEYYDINVSIVGEGTSQIDRTISIGQNDSVRYLFNGKSGWCLSDLSINGVAVSTRELVEISQYGLLLKNLDADVSITATFTKGIYLSLKYGENIKDAYLVSNKDNQRFYDGDVIPADYFGNPFDKLEKEDFLKPDFDIDDVLRKDLEFYDFEFSVEGLSMESREKALPFLPAFSKLFTLIVEVKNDEEGYLCIPDNVTTYDTSENGIYKKDVVISSLDSFKVFDIGSATKAKIQDISLRYEVNSNVLDHYLSTNRNATSGEQDSAVYRTGQIVYLFIEIPENTDMYHYQAPAGFTKVNGQWYQKAICVMPDEADLGTVEVTREHQSYTVTWKNADGRVITYEDYLYGEFPVFKGKNGNGKSPSKDSDGIYKYVFKDWDMPLEAVTCDVTYTAEFDAVLLQFNIFTEPTKHGTITPDEVQKITPLEQCTYTFTPNKGYVVADVVLNGKSLGPISSYTFTDVTEDQVLSVRIERALWFTVILWIVTLAPTSAIVLGTVIFWVRKKKKH